MKRCLIIGAAPVSGALLEQFSGREKDYIICADGGYQSAVDAGLRPDLVVGDFDSMERPKDAGVEILQVAAEKDDTDMMLALKEGAARGYEEFVLLGSLGGRLDHTVANLQAVAWGLERGLFVMLADENNLVAMLRGDSAGVPRLEGYYLSLFSYSEQCRGVTVRGVKYPLEDAVLTQAFPLGVSNEIVEREAFLRVEEGTLLIVMSREA
ncbi:MAG: thiamine diphosphokinase [Oscillospiraceae bacterium]|nr:thiamine diphosphokinase [Oscillospiraceae bacterium]